MVMATRVTFVINYVKQFSNHIWKTIDYKSYISHKTVGVYNYDADMTTGDFAAVCEISKTQVFKL